MSFRDLSRSESSDGGSGAGAKVLCRIICVSALGMRFSVTGSGSSVDVGSFAGIGSSSAIEGSVGVGASIGSGGRGLSQSDVAVIPCLSASKSSTTRRGARVSRRSRGSVGKISGPWCCDLRVEESACLRAKWGKGLSEKAIAAGKNDRSSDDSLLCRSSVRISSREAGRGGRAWSGFSGSLSSCSSVTCSSNDSGVISSSRNSSCREAG